MQSCLGVCAGNLGNSKDRGTTLASVQGQPEHASNMDLNINLGNLSLLVQVVEAGGFTAAARRTGTTRSLLSRRIIDLERQLGVQLLHRNARHFTVTSVGEQVYRQAVLMCEAAQGAVAAAREVHALHGGLVRVDAPDLLAPMLAGVVAGFAKRFPQVRIEATSNHGRLDALLRQRTDVMLGMGTQLPDSTDVVARTLGSMRLVVVASPKLMDELGHPNHPDRIDDVHYLGYRGGGIPHEWNLRGVRERAWRPRLTSGQLPTLLSSALAGLGFAQLPLYACREALASGQLCLAFEAFEARPVPLYGLSMQTKSLGENSLKFIDFVREYLSKGNEEGFLPFDSTL